MELTKAIEILDLNINEAGKKMPADTLDALKLGVEALKAVMSHRKDFRKGAIYDLPGETEGD